jgi:hypothetical protein
MRNNRNFFSITKIFKYIEYIIYLYITTIKHRKLIFWLKIHILLIQRILEILFKKN